MSWSRAALLALIPWLFIVAIILGTAIWDNVTRGDAWSHRLAGLGLFVPAFYWICVRALRISTPVPRPRSKP